MTKALHGSFWSQRAADVPTIAVTSDPRAPRPIRYDDCVETLLSDEEAIIEQTIVTMQRTMEKTFEVTRHGLTSEFFGGQGAVWELRAQLGTDLQETPVEDASIEWPEDLTLYRTVATITVEAQDTYSPERRVFADDELSFNPWHCLLEHQPLGSIQRVRRPVYADSVRVRSHLNALEPREPETIDTLPE